MKKIFAIFALAAILMVPMSVLALTTVSDSDLSAVTGQSGVSINLDVTVSLTANVIAWGDTDGIQNIQGYGDNMQGDAAYNTTGYIGLDTVSIQGLRLRMRDFSDVLGGGTMANQSEWTTLMGQAKSIGTSGGATNSYYNDVVAAKTAAAGMSAFLANVSNLQQKGTFMAYITNAKILVSTGNQSGADAQINLAAAINGGNTSGAATSYNAAAAAGLKAQADAIDVMANAFVIHNAYSKALTIDVGTDPNYYGTGKPKTIVSIGIPSMKITLDSMISNVALYPAGVDTQAYPNPNAISAGVDTGNKQVLGGLFVSNLEVLTWGGRVDISANPKVYTTFGVAIGNNVGVDIGFRNVQIEKITANGISWGDFDGVYGTALTNGANWGNVDKAGYVGLGGMKIYNLILNGDVTIDVASVDTQAVNNMYKQGWTTFVNTAFANLNAGYDHLVVEYIMGMKKVLGSPSQNDDITYVHLGMNNFSIFVDSMYLPVMLWSNPNLMASAGAGGATNLTEHELGVIYMKNLNVKVANGGWVDIIAH